VTGVNLDFPEAIFIKRLDGTGYGFFYSTVAQFQNAAHGFIAPIKERIEKESNEHRDLPMAPEELTLKASISSMAKVFEPNWNDQEGIDGARCVAASCVLESKWEEEIPCVIVIEQAGDEITIREGFEFLEHPGYPLAVVIGSKHDGGGLCSFFDTIEEFKQVATKPPTENTWMPQLIYRLYAKTPSIMTGIPVPLENGKGVGVECNAYTLNRKGQLIERRRRG
jgi:hypothetical protein